MLDLFSDLKNLNTREVTKIRRQLKRVHKNKYNCNVWSEIIVKLEYIAMQSMQAELDV